VEARAGHEGAAHAPGTVSEDLPLFRISDDRQLRELRAVTGELAGLRDRLRRAVDRG
jgi:hypothetical protein